MAEYTTYDNPLILYPSSNLTIKAIFSETAPPPPTPSNTPVIVPPTPTPTPSTSELPLRTYSVSITDENDLGDSTITYSNLINRGRIVTGKTITGIPEGSRVSIQCAPAAGGFRTVFVQLEANGRVISYDPYAEYIVTENTAFVAKYNVIADPPQSLPAPPPTPSRSPIPSPAPTQTPVASSVPLPSPSPQPAPSQTPFPTPTATPITWVSCIDDTTNVGTAPPGWRQVFRTAAGGGMCWEPQGMVSFEPSLSTALVFRYQRGSATFPQPITVRAQNPSYASAYSVTLTTNPDIIITPSVFTVPPRGSVSFIVNATPALMDKLADGTSVFDLNADIQQVV